MRDQVSGVTRDLVLAPAGAEIAQYERFRQELAVASACYPEASPSPPGAWDPCPLPRRSVAALLPSSVRGQGRALWLAGNRSPGSRG